MREFRRSSRFGLIGVFVVAGIAVAVALSADSTDPNPKLQLGLIFGVIAAFLAVLLLLQRGDIDRAATGDARAFGQGFSTREVCQENGRSELILHARVSEFEVKVRDGRFSAKDGASKAAAVLGGLPASERWKGVCRPTAAPTGSSSTARAIRVRGSAISGWPSGSRTSSE